MRRLFLVIITLSGVALFCGGCYYDNEETLYPPGGCDTLDVRYSVQVVEILTNKCYDCHSNANAPINGNDIVWEGYANIASNFSPPGGVPTFLACINHDIGATPMPKDRPKLSACDIRILEIWIANGYPDN